MICHRIWERLKYNVDDSFRVDSETLGHPEHYDQRDKLYGNYIPKFLNIICKYSTYPDVGYHY